MSRKTKKIAGQRGLPAAVAIDRSLEDDVGLRPTPRQGTPATSIVAEGTAEPSARFG